MDPATREIEIKYVNNLIEPRQQQHEDDFTYILRIRNLYNTNIWVYTSRVQGKVEMFKLVDDFDKDKENVKIIVCSNHCDQIENIETLLDRPNKRQYKFY